MQKRREDREKKEQQKRSADADEGRVRIRRRKNGTIGAVTGRTNGQLKGGRTEGR